MVRDTTVEGDWGSACYPLSPMQQGMLFHHLEGRIPGIDVEQVVAELRHPVNAPDFAQAWQMVAARHESFRTTFLAPTSAVPTQRVEPVSAVEFPVRVLDFASPRDAARAVQQYLSADRRLGFAALKAPLARVALFRTGHGPSWFVLTYHHLILDARGMYHLFKEVLDLHDAFARGTRPPLSAPRPYRDYITWLDTLDLHRAERFWREQLKGFSAATPIPLSPPDLPPSDALPGELAFRLTTEQTTELRTAATRYGTTLNTLVQAAWSIVLSRYSGEDDVVFGAVRACRHVPVEGAGSMVAMLINTVPMRVRLAANATVAHWLAALREQWITLRDFEHTPLVKIQQWSDVTPGRPLFESVLNFQEPSWIEALGRLGGAWAQRRFEIYSQPNYPLALDVYGDAALGVRAFYDRRRSAGEAVAQILRHFRTALLQLGSGRIDRLGDVSLLDPQERRQVLGEWNQTDLEYPRNDCIHRAVERAAAAQPERIAVADGRSALTYAELNRRANRLARRLVDHGVGRETRVAVCLPRSVEMIVAWLAALKAGGAYVPLDRSYPHDRLVYQVRDCQARVVIVPAGKPAAAWPANVAVIELAEGPVAEDQSEENLSEISDATNLAYVIHTSGSTGEPKGVAVEHRSLFNLVSWHQRTYSISPDDRATQVASPAFDASVWEVWPYLTAGASVHLPDEETRVTPAALWDWIAEQGITIAFLPTPVAEAALADRWPAKMALRALLTGGDRLQRSAPREFPCALFNHYGPTENTVVATAARVPAGRPGTPTIGRPIANTKAYVLDRDRKPVPVGVVGELYLGGASLARGYLGRPELTSERFVVDSFSTSAGESPDHDVAAATSSSLPRLYRTGDLVRWRTDGQLEFIGRADHQVKIRGCRVEPGEIELVFQRHPAVREAVVLSVPDHRGHPELAAYVVCRAGTGASANDLLDFVRGMLPGYMVPASVIVLETWPLTTNGKIDRRALPAPTSTMGHRPLTLPRTDDEQLIAKVWADVLGRDPIGVDDNFFELGGHSLRAAQAISRINAAIGGTHSVRLLFDHPTVSELARELSRRGPVAARRTPVLQAKRRHSSTELELIEPR